MFICYYFFLNQCKYTPVHSFIFVEHYMSLYEHCFYRHTSSISEIHLFYKKNLRILIFTMKNIHFSQVCTLYAFWNVTIIEIMLFYFFSNYVWFKQWFGCTWNSGGVEAKTFTKLLFTLLTFFIIFCSNKHLAFLGQDIFYYTVGSCSRVE